MVVALVERVKGCVVLRKVEVLPARMLEMGMVEMSE